jgi:transcriptional regulator with XRE-family HTH domain
VAQRKTARSRRLGKQIRRLRDDAQLTQEKLVELMNADQPRQRRISAAHLSRVESGIARITSEHLDRIGTVLAVGAELAQKLDELRRRADERGWWQEYADIVTEAVEMLAEIGEDAATARSYDNVYVQGLLQTRAYAEAVIGNDRAFVSPINVDRMADLRMRRQQRLGEDGFQGLVAVDSDTALRICEDRDPVRQYTYIYDAALAQALPARQSQDLIRAVMEEL